MPSPVLPIAAVAPGTSGWDARSDANFENIQALLVKGPTRVNRMWRVSTGHTEDDQTLNLVNYPAASFHGCYAHIEDPESGEKPLAYSDGTDWRYLLTDNALTGIV